MQTTSLMARTFTEGRGLRKPIRWAIAVFLVALLTGCATDDLVRPGEMLTKATEGVAGMMRGFVGGEDDRSLGGLEPIRGLGPMQAAAIPSDGSKFALVIGNSRYQYKALGNPGNDARSMARVLQAKGFEVDQHLDLNSARLQEAVRAFGERLGTRSGVGIVYFAGHGVEVDGENYLIPVDNDRIRDNIDVRQYGLSLNYLLDRLKAAGNPLNIVILDACRDDPYHGSSRSLTRGLRTVSSPSGTLIAFAAAPGQRASDNSRNGNGLYTQYLVKALEAPGRRIEDVFHQVRRDVVAASDGEQEPWYNASLDGIYCIGGCPAAEPPVAAASAQSVSAMPPPDPATIPKLVSTLPGGGVGMQTMGLMADAFFDYDRYVLKPAGVASLQALLADLARDGVYLKRIGLRSPFRPGSDPEGNVDQASAGRRMLAVKQFLVGKGVPEEYIELEFEEDRGSNDSPEARALLRRVEINTEVVM